MDPLGFRRHSLELDSVEIASYPHPVGNVVAVEVDGFGADSFESVPSFRAFLVWGRAGGESLATAGVECALCRRGGFGAEFIGPVVLDVEGLDSAVRSTSPARNMT